MSADIVPLLPPHRSYIEPFCGGAAVYWAKNPVPHEVLNDNLKGITNFYAVWRDRGQATELLERMKHTPYARDTWLLGRQAYRAADMDDPVMFAWGFWVLSRMGFGGKLDSGWGASWQGNRARGYACAVDEVEAEFEAIHARLRNTIVDNVDALVCIERYDAPEALFYCDPPYPGTNQGHYKGYTWVDYDRLIAALATCRASVVLSGYMNDRVPADWPRHDFAAVQSIGAVRREDKTVAELGRKTECVWVLNRSKYGQIEIM